MRRTLVLVLGLLAAVALALIITNPGAVPATRPAPATPSPTPCRVIRVADNGTQSCFYQPPFGSAPQP